MSQMMLKISCVSFLFLISAAVLRAEVIPGPGLNAEAYAHCKTICGEAEKCVGHVKAPKDISIRNILDKATHNCRVNCGLAHRKYCYRRRGVDLAKTHPNEFHCAGLAVQDL